MSVELDQLAELSLEELMNIPIIVTESKNPQTLKSVTQKINIISEKDIDQMILRNRNITELLLYEPGVSVSVLSINDTNGGSYGGFGPEYNLFLISGLPIDSFIFLLLKISIAFV